jgi:hypothetical protein
LHDATSPQTRTHVVHTRTQAQSCARAADHSKEHEHARTPLSLCLRACKRSCDSKDSAHSSHGTIMAEPMVPCSHDFSCAHALHDHSPRSRRGHGAVTARSRLGHGAVASLSWRSHGVVTAWSRYIRGAVTATVPQGKTFSCIFFMRT